MPCRVSIFSLTSSHSSSPHLQRIDKKILLGYMAVPDVASMLEHYFQTSLTESQFRRLEKIIVGDIRVGKSKLDLTPAQVEQLAAEHDELDEMIDAMDAMGGVGDKTGDDVFGIFETGCDEKKSSLNGKPKAGDKFSSREDGSKSPTSVAWRPVDSTHSRA